MDKVSILPPESLGRNFIPLEYLPKGKDEYYLRNKQTIAPKGGWRSLKSDEIEKLVKNGNTADSWDDILVTDEFVPYQIKGSQFYGLVRIGRLRNVIVQHHDLKLPAGITNSLIISCDIGDDVAIHNVNYLAHYIIGDRCILFNVKEMHTTNHSKFGNGIVKEGEPENVRVALDLMNETGCRKVFPFDGMTTADAYLWAKYIDDKPLQERLKRITQASFDNRRGYYGSIGNCCVIKNSLIVKDVKVGSNCYIKGANKLKNLTINSSKEEPTQIGEGVELVNGIIGFGCHIFYGCKAVRFILGNNSNLKYGARLIHSYLGDNSTISCCEVLNNLIFPSHEQHHNNSFLVASVVMGQSNMAAGATIGSNHNSRANDNEIQAGRGFWPGLCVSLKHSSRFASFVLLSKADYPAELSIPFPFSLINSNVTKDRLEVIPAFWWLYNMYALARNSWKFQSRDKRVHKVQNIEFETFAPDSVEEMISARKLIEIWTAKASMRSKGEPTDLLTEEQLAIAGCELLTSSEEAINSLEVLGENMENSKRKVVILKTHKAYRAYGEMLHYYAIKNLLDYFLSNPNSNFASMCKDLKGKRQSEWVNLGGQIIRSCDLDKLRADIGEGTLSTWNDIHERYNELWERYRLDKQKHAFAVLCELIGKQDITKEDWELALNRVMDIQQYICNQVYITRNKDYANKFKQSTFRNREEMDAAVGTIDMNSFIVQIKQETQEFKDLIGEIKLRS